MTPKLYGSICIDVWVHGGELELFVGCLELGAKKHMKTTKELHFVDATMDPADPSSIYPQRNTFILEILKSLADDKLRSFRYVEIEA